MVCNDLTSLNGLNNIVSIGTLIIEDNPMLNTLAHLSSFTTMGTIEITNNASLTSLHGLGTITSFNTSVVELTIKNNISLLDMCPISASLSYIYANTTQVFIFGNANPLSGLEILAANCE